MFKKSKNNKMTYGIVGLGRFGTALALDLAESGSEIIAIDSNEEKVREIREVTENAFIVNNLEKKTLIETGIQNCDVAIVCIGEHMDSSILTTLNIVYVIVIFNSNYIQTKMFAKINILNTFADKFIRDNHF